MSTSAVEAAERAAAAALPPDFHAESEIKAVKLKELKVDHSYQRDISPSLVEKIKNNWDEVASELILVSQRSDGTLWIINGQHRTAAARLLGQEKIWARIVKGLGPAQEAALRLKTNVRMTDRPLERFRASVVAGDEDSIGIVKLLARLDTEINVSPTLEAGINAVTAVENIYTADNGATLQETLEFIKGTYNVVGGRYTTAPILRAVAWFVTRHSGGEANFERMQELLKGFGISAWDRRARVLQAEMGGTLWLNYYRAMISIYNEKLPERQKLEWRTRGATASGGFGAQHDGRWS